MVNNGCVIYRNTGVSAVIICHKPIGSGLRDGKRLGSVPRVPNHIPNGSSRIKNNSFIATYRRLHIRQNIDGLLNATTAQVNGWYSVVHHRNGIKAISSGVDTARAVHHNILRIRPLITINELVLDIRIACY